MRRVARNASNRSPRLFDANPFAIVTFALNLLQLFGERPKWRS
jgi:hypothetical protein